MPKYCKIFTKDRLLLAVKVLAILLVAWLVTKWLVYDISSLSYFSQEKSSDFTISDFYDNVSHNSGRLTLDPKIVVVGIDDCDHAEIGEILSFVRNCDPAAIGLDVGFHFLDNDSVLLDALSYAADRLVFPVSIDVETGQMDATGFEDLVEDDLLEGASPGNVTFTTTSSREVVRQFYSQIPGSQPFDVVIASRVDPEAVQVLKDRGNVTETISFAERNIYTITDIEIFDGLIDPSVIEGKAVLLGTLDDLNDKHITPIDNDMSGVKVHAYILSTILNQEYVSRAPAWLENLFACVITVLIIILCIAVEDKPYNNLVSRIIPIAIILAFVYTGYRHYIEGHWYIDFAPILLMAASAMLVFDIWMAVSYFISKAAPYVKPSYRWTKKELTKYHHWIKNKLTKHKNTNEKNS